MVKKTEEEIASAMMGADIVPLKGGGSIPDGDQAPRPGGLPKLPDDCPVRPLGVLGDVVYYLDGLNQLRPLKTKDHSRLQLQGLFIPQTRYVYKLWPKMNKDGEIKTWQPEVAAEQLMGLAGEKGIFNPMENLRGPGCWRGDDGELIMHLGDEIMVDGERFKPGLIGNYVYPGFDAGPKPKKTLNMPGLDLKDLFSSWSFKRDMDPHLLVGWVVAAILSGALAWRPLCWLTGDKATGKSTLQLVIADVIGKGGIISVTDTTPAGLWQRLGYKSLPVALDEFEAEEDNRKNNAVIKLAREAASGGAILRGGSEHNGMEFKARSCFLFSSILMPSLAPQDQSRMAILSLDPIPKGKKPPVMDKKNLRRIGLGIRHEIMTRWGDFDDILQAYSLHLGQMGHGGRSADVFGTLMACAHLVLYDDVPYEEFLDQVCAGLDPQTMLEKDDEISDHQACLEYLLLKEIDLWKGGTKKQIVKIINAAIGNDQDYGPDSASEVLQRYGLRVIEETDVRSPDYRKSYLMVANAHPGLSKIFENTHWAGRPNGKGVWVQALRRCPGSFVPKKPQKFNGVSKRGTYLPMVQVLGELGDFEPVTEINEIPIL